MKKHSLQLTCFLSMLSIARVVPAQDSVRQEPIKVFELGEVQITGRRLKDSTGVLSWKKIQEHNRLDLSNALNLLPGVSLGNIGPRNESVVFIRGFDLKQVPVFIDGVPVYVPYDGYVDFGRFLVSDLSQIRVDKGLSSVLLGPNTMGGAINLVTRKPQEAFEYEGAAGWMSGEGYRAHLNLGSRVGKFFTQGGIGYLDRKTYPLAQSFEAVASKDGGNRENAYRQDLKLNLKVGFSPNGKDEYALGYLRQDGEKGNPPYTGADPSIRVRYWQWPYWDKESWYFLSNTSIGAGKQIKVRLFYDAFQNALYSYDDATYTKQTKAYAFQSFYSDYSFGGNSEFGAAFGKHDVKVAAYFKHDTHRENNLGEPRRTMADNTLSLAAEDLFSLGERWLVAPGLSFNRRVSLQADHFIPSEGRIDEFPSNDNNAFNLQSALYFKPSSQNQFRASIALKTRFATLKDRYSYRLGQGIPNPDLKSESAIHYELAYTGKAAQQKLTIQLNAFYSQLIDAIQQVDQVQGNLFQLQNTGKARFAGLEASLEYRLSNQWQLGANYAYIDQKNQDRPEIRFLNVPRHKIMASGLVQIARFASLLGTAEYNSERFSTSYGTRAEAFTVVSLTSRWVITPALRLQLGANNLLDANYALVEGFPEEGRTFFVTLTFQKP
ncbi:MAG: TonB-dependent receptor [Saprospiraceae bacterium]|nr:TonB-dependent receptor [Saprospiraceae bacterium]